MGDAMNHLDRKHYHYPRTTKEAWPVNDLNEPQDEFYPWAEDEEDTGPYQWAWYGLFALAVCMLVYAYWRY
jgi:hypothetical protein